MTLGCEIVDFGGLRFLNDAYEIGQIRHVAEIQKESYILFVWVPVQMIHPARIERRRSPFHPVHDVTLAEQKLREICAVLAGDAGN